MADEKPQENQGSTVGGWAKAIATSIVGLVSGAALMYLTPLVNNAIKPPKPVANFAAQPAGLTVNFNNLSSGGVQGWWDFGDGTALEPFDPNADKVKHAYAKPGSYNVKLTLANLLGEESDRTVPVNIDGTTPVAEGPAIETFDLQPWPSKRETAPAIYKLTSKAKNASYCLLSHGDSRPMEIVSPGQDVYLNFEEAGNFIVRLAAVNGKQIVEQTKTIRVGAGDGNSMLAKMFVSYEAVHVERLERNARVFCGWQGDTKTASSAFRKEWAAEPGYTIVTADLLNKDDKNAPVRNIKCDLAADKSKVVITGELTRATGILAPKAAAPHWVAEVKLVQERRTAPQTIKCNHVTMAVGMNSSIKLPMQPLPPGYEIVRKNVMVQLWDGPRKVWEGSNAVNNISIKMNNQPCLVSANPQADGFVVTLAPMGPVIQTGGFQLFPKKAN